MLGLPVRLPFLALLFFPGYTCPFPQQLGGLLFPFLPTRSQGAELELEMLRKGVGVALLSTMEQLRETWLNFASVP